MVTFKPKWPTLRAEECLDWGFELQATETESGSNPGGSFANDHIENSKEQGPPVQHRELYSVTCNNIYGKESEEDFIYIYVYVYV